MGRGGGDGLVEGGVGVKKASPTCFYPVTSTNIGISPKIFRLLMWTFFPHWSKISMAYPVPVPISST